MSSEKFDDRIRQKLDQLEPANDAAAWNRIQSRLPASPGMWASVSWKKTGIALYMAGTTAALVLLWWNQEKLDHRNQELGRKVQQLLSGSEALPASVSKSESQGKATEKGTVAYPNGHLQGSGSSDGFQGNGSTSGAGKTAHPEALYSVQANDSDRLLRVEQAEQPGIQQKTRKPKGKGNAIEAAALSAKENSPALGSGNKEQSRAPQGLDGIAAMEERNPERTAGSASQKNINQMAQAQSPVESNALEQVAVNKPVTLDSVRRDSVLVVKKDTVPAAIRKLGSTKKSSFLANLIPRIGLDFSTDFESLAGPGLHAEFFLSPKFTASVGFIAYFPVKEQFRNEKDYNIRTGQNFLAEYGDHLPANFHEVEAIQVKTRVLEIPVRFRYFTPIDAHWQWLIGMGTHFNISAKQELNCEVHMDQGEDEFLSYSHTPAPGLFHNLEFSTGLEYRNGGLAFRITPYYQYNFTTLQYLDKVHLLGLNLGLYFKP